MKKILRYLMQLGHNAPLIYAWACVCQWEPSSRIDGWSEKVLTRQFCGDHRSEGRLRVRPECGIYTQKWRSCYYYCYRSSLVPLLWVWCLKVVRAKNTPHTKSTHTDTNPSLSGHRQRHQVLIKMQLCEVRAYKNGMSVSVNCCS